MSFFLDLFRWPKLFALIATYNRRFSGRSLAAYSILAIDEQGNSLDADSWGVRLGGGVGASGGFNTSVAAAGNLVWRCALAFFATWVDGGHRLILAAGGEGSSLCGAGRYRGVGSFLGPLKAGQVGR